MAFPTAVNDQITDAVTQSGVSVLASASTHAAALLQQGVAQALANAAHNATTHQQNINVLSQAATTRAVARLLGARGGAA